MGPSLARRGRPRIPDHLSLLLLIGVSFLAGCAVSEGCALRAGDAPARKKALSSVLRELAAAPDPAAFARSRGFSLVEGKARVVIRFAESATDEEVRAVASRRSLTLEKRVAQAARVLVSPAELLSLEGEPSVVYIDLPDVPGK